MYFYDDENSLFIFEMRSLLDILILSAQFQGIDKADRVFKKKKYF